MHRMPDPTGVTSNEATDRSAARCPPARNTSVSHGAESCSGTTGNVAVMILRSSVVPQDHLAHHHAVRSSGVCEFHFIGLEDLPVVVG